MRGFIRILGTLALALLVAGLSVAPAEAGKATIIRDEYGVPHVYGNNLKGTWFGVGYAMAQDRLWQADVLRRTGTGTQAEYFGASAIAGDAGARALFGPQERRRAQFNGASKKLKKIFRAYARGVNAYIAEATAAGTLPVEYEGLGLPPPRPWTTDDSIAVSMALLGNFGEAGADEFDHLDDLQQFVARFGATEGTNIFIDTHLLDDPAAPTSVPQGAAALTAAAVVSTPEAVLDAAPDIDARLLSRKFNAALKGLRRNLERAGVGEGPASNAIAIGPGLSASGRPLLLGGPQMGYATPQINHEMGVHGGGYNVTGMSIAGIPAVVIGVNKKLAWTLTTGGTDTQDIYLESVSGDQYAFGGALRDFDCRLETINVRGAAPHQQVLCSTVHGPVIEQIPGLAVTVKGSSQGFEFDSLEAVHGLMTAGNIRQFDRALSKASYNYNVLYADVKGKIG
jgi:penicillin amidase